MTKHTSTRETAYEMIVDLLVGGAISPSQPLSERTLSELIGLGRMPVREAIKDLARDGLLEVIPLRGTFVRGLSLQELGELFEVRAALEGVAAYKAAQNGGSAELQVFRDQFVQAKNDMPNIDWKATYNAGAEFHVAIFEAANNRLLFETYKPIRMRFRIPMGLSQTYDRDWVLQSIDEHIDILDHIMAGRASQAQQYITEHLHRAYLSKRKIMMEMQRFETPLNVVKPMDFTAE